MRTLKVNILTFFLTLLCLSFLCVIGFIHSRNYKTILGFSKGVAEQSSAIILSKFQSIANSSERITKSSAGFFPELAPFTFENTLMLSFLLNVVKFDTNFSNFYVGLPDGGFIGVLSLAVSAQKTYIGDTSKPLPPGTAFFLRHLDRSVSPARDHWYYLNKDFKEVGSEVLVNTTSDVRMRPWFVGAEKQKGLFWTDLYAFLPGVERGITVSDPMYGQNGELIGVIGADLTMLLLDKFVMSQKVGNKGRVYILDQQGKIVVPGKEGGVDPGAIDPNLITSLYRSYTATPSHSSLLARYKGEQYLGYISPLPVVFGAKWYVLAVAPSKDFFAQMIRVQDLVLGIVAAILFLSGLIVVYFAKRISSPIVRLAHEVDRIRQLDLTSETRVHTHIREIFQMDQAVASMRRVIRSFARYVPREIVKDLFDKNEEITLGGKKKEVTIFFSDIAGFTTITESLSIEELIPLMSEYFDAMSKIILRSHGTIDKFVGDGIMAFWGAPIEFKDHGSRACIAALRCHAMLVELNKKRREENKPEFLTRFGINTGTVIVGNIGTEERMNYTIIGNAVNATAHLQEVDKVFHTSIIIGQEVYEELGGKFVVRPLDLIEVKGRKEKTRIYELMGTVEGEEEIQATPQQVELSRAFTAAFETLERGDPEKALAQFREIEAKIPDDFPTRFYINRIEGKTG